MIVELKWWLSNLIGQAFKAVVEAIHSVLDSKILAVFKAARIGWTPESGLEIFWEDINIKPPVDDDLKRRFLQEYNNFLASAGTVNNDELLKSFFNLAYVYSIDMRDHELMGDIYPFFVVRYWIPPVDPQLKEDIKSIIDIILPARCTRHYQLLTWYEELGFGRTAFGRKFGR